jgi:hypothetical protein
MHAFKHMMGLVVHPAAFSFESAAIHHSSPEGRERPAGGAVYIGAANCCCDVPCQPQNINVWFGYRFTVCFRNSYTEIFIRN